MLFMRKIMILESHNTDLELILLQNNIFKPSF